MLRKLFFLTFCLLIFSCKTKEKREFLRIPLTAQPSTLDWNLASDANSFDVIINIMEGLLQYDDDLRVLPAIAESYQANEDFTQYTFTLRKKALWSDFAPIICQHFKDSWIRLLKPETAAEYAYFLYSIKNAEAFNSGKIKDPEKLGIRCLSDRKLVVDLENSVPFFHHLVTFMVTYPIRKDLLDKNPKFFSPGNMVVTGPFIPSKQIQDYKIVLEKNPSYFGKEPKSKMVEFYIVENESIALNLFSGKILDMVRNIPPNSLNMFSQDPRLHSFNKFGLIYLGFGKKLHPGLKDPQTRRYIFRNINRTWLCKALAGGEKPISQFVPRGMLGFSRSLEDELIKDPVPNSIKKWNYPNPIKLSYRTSGTFPLIAENLQAQLAKIGIPILLMPMDDKMFFQSLNADSQDLFIGRWIADFPDPENFLSLFLSNSGNNHTFFRNFEYDALVKEARSLKLRTERRKIYDKAQKILLDKEIALAPLFQMQQNMLLSSKLKDFIFNSMDMIILKEAYLENP